MKTKNMNYKLNSTDKEKGRIWGNDKQGRINNGNNLFNLHFYVWDL